jgi:hypothetical protein
MASSQISKPSKLAWRKNGSLYRGYGPAVLMPYLGTRIIEGKVYFPSYLHFNILFNGNITDRTWAYCSLRARRQKEHDA